MLIDEILSSSTQWRQWQYVSQALTNALYDKKDAYIEAKEQLHPNVLSFAKQQYSGFIFLFDKNLKQWVGTQHPLARGGL